MSTKSSISFDKNFHLYQEIFDVSNVYLQVEGHEYEVRNDRVMVQIPIKAWRKMIADWNQRGWPESEDHTESKIKDEWLELPLFMSKKNSNGGEDEENRG
jgi:hypothetical protein